jgi:AraC-like DNA-binding protein
LVVEAPPATGWESLHFDVVYVPRRRLDPGNPSLTHVRPAAQPGPEAVWGCRPPLVVPEPLRTAALDTLRSCGWLWWRGAAGPLRANARLAAWLADYVGGCMPTEEKSYAEVADPWLKRVREAALAGLETGITAKGLAAALGIDRETLRRRLWRADRETPGNLLRRLRIDRAQRELAHGETVRAVARFCGYRSVTAFSNAFRRATGKPPGRWAAGIRLR